METSHVNPPLPYPFHQLDAGMYIDIGIQKQKTSHKLETVWGLNHH